MAKPPVVIEVPGAASSLPGASSDLTPPAPVPPEPIPPAPEPEPQPTPDPPLTQSEEEVRATLREGMANIGLGRHYGNMLADWFDQQGMTIAITGSPEEAPRFRVHSHPDEAPAADPAVFGMHEDKTKEVFNATGEVKPI